MFTPMIQARYQERDRFAADRMEARTAIKIVGLLRWYPAMNCYVVNALELADADIQMPKNRGKIGVTRP